jgi:hypothetical protein
MTMAEQQQVKRYLAHWFQTGKAVIESKKGDKILPSIIIEGDRYSSEFEICWQKLLTQEHQDSYLEGTSQTIKQLLSPQWEIIACARCQMPVPICSSAVHCSSCPCFDLDLWPNNDLPSPHAPIDSRFYLRKIHDRLG